MSKILKFIPIIVITSIVIIFFSDTLFKDKTFVYGDIHSYFYPMKFFLAQSVKSGYLPHWNPYERCGVPFLANPQVGVFYPLSIILYIFPFPFSFNLFIVLHFILGGIFFFLLVKELGIGSIPSMIGGVIFIFSGTIISFIHVLNNLQSAIWVPLFFLLFIKFLKSRSLLSYIGCSITIAISILGGEFQIVLMSFILLAFLGAIFTYKEIKYKKKWLLFTLTIITIPIISILISMIQLLPTYTLFSTSERAIGIRAETAMEWSFHPIFTLNFLIPNLLFSPYTYTSWPEVFHSHRITWLGSYYFGILSLFLILFGILSKKKDKLISSIFLSSIFAYILSFGRYTPLYPFLLNHLKGFNIVRFPEKFLFITLFLSSTLASFGISQLLEKKEDNLRKLWGVSIIIGLFICIGFLVILSLIKNYPINFLGFTLTLNYIQFIEDQLIYLSYILAITAIISGLSCRFKNYKYILGLFLLIIITFDLWRNNQFLTPTVPNDLYLIPPKVSNELPKEDFSYRISFSSQLRGTQEGLTLQYRILTEELFPNIGTLYHIPLADGSNVINPFRQVKLLSNLRHDKERYRKSLMDAINVRYILSYDNFQNEPNLIKIKEISPLNLKLYENKKALPRIFIVRNPHVIDNPNEAIPLILKGMINLNEEVIIEDKELKLIGQNEIIEENNSPLDNYKCSIKNYTPNNIIIETAANFEGYLVLLDTYYPEWKVKVDGKEDKILQVNYTFRGVKLEAGEHIVEFFYSPTSFKIGKRVTLITLGGILVCIIIILISKNSKIEITLI